MAETIISTRDLRAGEVCAELQEWVENIEGVSATPIVALVLTAGKASIEIGHVVVWDDEENEDRELTFEFCKKAYQEEIADLTPFLDPPTLSH